MNVLDTSIANVSIPAISGDLGVSPNKGTWVITSFAVSMAIALPLSGWLAKRFGEVRLFVWSVALFTLASFLCGLSFNLPMLVIFRIIQGAVAGPMIPLSQSLLMANYPDEKKGFAMSLWAMTAVVAPVFGPVMGGWITDNYHWPWIFYINIPVGIFSFYVTWYLLKNRETEKIKLPIDIVGLILLIIGVGSLQILLDKANELDWFNSDYIIALGIIAIIALSFFIVWELTEKHPVVDLNLFKRRNFTVGTIAIALGYLGFFGGVVIFPLWLQTQMGYTASWAGLAAAPIGILPVFLSPIVGKNLHKIDLRLLSSVSFIIFTLVSFWNSQFNSSTDIFYLVLPRFIQGLGIACFFIPLVSILLSGLPANQIASASGLSNFLRILGGSFGTSISTNIWSHREAYHQSILTETINPFNPALTNALNSLHQIPLTSPTIYQQLSNTIIREAYILATNDFFWLSAWLFAGLLFIIWLANLILLRKKNKAVDAH